MSRLLTAEELAERWQVPKSQVYRLTRDGAIPAVKLGRYYRFHPAAIERWEAGEHNLPSPTKNGPAALETPRPITEEEPPREEEP